MIGVPRKIVYDADFDIEGQHVLSIDRREDGESRICVARALLGEDRAHFLRCSEEKHNDLLSRFRAKIAAKKD